MSVLAINDVRVAFGQAEAVAGVTLAIERGEMMALVGESGSGKSLTALSVLGLLPETAVVSGSIRFEGEELAGATEAVLKRVRGARIGMVFQEPMSALNPLHTIGRQIGEAIALHHRLEKDAVQARVVSLLEQVGLGHFAQRLDAYPHQLSGGERQRVLIAMAIANDPALLIADEPTTAVDVTVQVKILALLKKLQRERGMAMLFITHDLTLVKRLADRVAVMRRGRIVEQGKVSDVFGAPQHPYTQALLSAEPKGLAEPLAADAPEVLAAENLRVSFPIRRGILRRTVGHTHAVRGVSLSIREGETLGIVGESGSGKSTLAFALLKLLPCEGRIMFMGADISHIPTREFRPYRRNMQVVFQDPYSSLNPRMNVRQIIEEGLRVHEPALSDTQRRARAAEAMAQVGLEESMLERYPHEFSGGQRQRIGIARAMVLRPRFVVLDEPTSALDLSVQAQLIALLKTLQKETKAGYLFISHDLRVVRAVSHRILVMRAGEVVEEGTAESLFAQPRQAYTKALIEAAFLNAAL